MGKDVFKIRCRILPIVWTKEQFERRQGNVTVFAKELLQRNSSKGIEVEEEDVIHHWWMLVDDMFPKGDPRRERYIAQTHSPAFRELWAEPNGDEDFDEQQEDGDFHRAQRPTERTKEKGPPGAVVLTKDGIETLLPNVNLSALKDIQYRTFVREVLEANTLRIITLPEMQLLWDAVVWDIFSYECSCIKAARANDSMGVDGFSQAEYNQLLFDLGYGVPRARPSIFNPSSKHSREIETPDRSVGTEDDCVGAASDDSLSKQRRKRRANDESPSVQIQKRRSKRRHRSGPGDEISIPDYPTLPSTSQSAPTHKDQLPALPSIFTRPVTVIQPNNMSEQEWLDPQLLGGPAMQVTGQAMGSRSHTGTMPSSEEANRVDGGPRVKKDGKEK